jgi:hypothetical protein
MRETDNERLIRTYLEDGIHRMPMLAKVDEESIMNAVRIKRRNRMAVSAIGSLALVIGVAGGVSAVAGGGRSSRDTRITAPANTRIHDYSPKQLASCGARIPSEYTTMHSPLTIDVKVPATAVSGATVKATVVITNVGSHTVSAVGASTPTLSMVGHEQVVTSQGPGRMEGLPLTLAPGQSRTFDLTLVAGQCSTEHMRVSQKDYAQAHPLPAGAYSVYAVYTLQVQGQSAIQTIASHPQPLTVS